MLWNTIRNIYNRKKWARWNSTPKDLVILHTFGKTRNVPSASPFVVKVQTYLRMAKIPHKTDSKDMTGPKGKAPWISLNGLHIGDSQLIIQHLNKHYKVDLNKGFSDSQLAVATCARVALEEHFIWGFALERFIYNPTQFSKVIGVGPIYDKVFTTAMGYVVNKRTDAQGMGRHSQAEVEGLCSKDLWAVSKIMGQNEFLLGKVPCEDDAAIFGMLAVCLWGLPNSPYEKLIKGELTNLRDYCLRMKEVYYPDWEQCIRRGSGGKSNTSDKGKKENAQKPILKAKL